MDGNELERVAQVLPLFERVKFPEAVLMARNCEEYNYQGQCSTLQERPEETPAPVNHPSDKLHPCVEKLEELIMQCLPGWSLGSAEAIQDQFKWEHFRNEAPAILDQHKNGECNFAEEYGKKFAKAKPDPDAKPDEEGEPDDELTDDEILDRQREENSEPDEGVSE